MFIALRREQAPEPAQTTMLMVPARREQLAKKHRTTIWRWRADGNENSRIDGGGDGEKQDKTAQRAQAQYARRVPDQGRQA
jgi:hypothetical protein